MLAENLFEVAGTAVAGVVPVVHVAAVVVAFVVVIVVALAVVAGVVVFAVSAVHSKHCVPRFVVELSWLAKLARRQNLPILEY